MKVEILHLSPARLRHALDLPRGLPLEPRPVSHRPRRSQRCPMEPWPLWAGPTSSEAALHRTFRAGVRVRSRRRGAPRRVSRTRRTRRALGVKCDGLKLRDRELWGQHARGRRLGRLLCRRAGRLPRSRRCSRGRRRLAEARPGLKAGRSTSLAANVDTVLIVTGLDWGDFNPRRLEPLPDRGVGQAGPLRARAPRSSTCVTTLDCCCWKPSRLRSGLPVLAVEATSRARGSISCSALLRPRQTFVLLGSSRQVDARQPPCSRASAATGDLRRDGRGPAHDPTPAASRAPERGAAGGHAGPPRAPGVGGGRRGRFLGHRRARLPLPVQRLRARDGAGLRGAGGARLGRARSCPLRELPQAGARAPLHRDSLEL